MWRINDVFDGLVVGFRDAVEGRAEGVGVKDLNERVVICGGKAEEKGNKRDCESHGRFCCSERVQGE